MEFLKVFPKSGKKEILIAESEAKFVFRNCPNGIIKSEQVEISEIGAKWYG